MVFLQSVRTKHTVKNRVKVLRGSRTSVRNLPKIYKPVYPSMIKQVIMSV